MDGGIKGSLVGWTVLWAMGYRREGLCLELLSW
jgi:hypothetical protein